MIIVQTLDAAVEHLLIADAPPADEEGAEAPPPLLTGVEATGATRTRA